MSPEVGCVRSTLSFTAPRRGYHLITDEVNEVLGSQLRQFQHGMCNLFIQHMSCSLTINHNSDPTVRDRGDETEEADDLPSEPDLLALSLDIPITSGALALGPLQGIYLCEHRTSKELGDEGAPRKTDIIITAHGEIAMMTQSTMHPNIRVPTYKRPDEPKTPGTKRPPTVWPNWDLPFDRT